MVSKASEDLPDPLGPVMTTSWLRGSSQLTFCRLCCRAPRTTRASVAGGGLLSGAKFMVGRGAESCNIFGGGRAGGPLRTVAARSAFDYGPGRRAACFAEWLLWRF